MPVCTMCGKDKPLSEYYHSKSGRLYRCKECQRYVQWVRDRKARNPELDTSRAAYDAHLKDIALIERKRAEGLRRCAGCSEWKPFDKFYVYEAADYKDGKRFSVYCRECSALQRRGLPMPKPIGNRTPTKRKAKGDALHKLLHGKW